MNTQVRSIREDGQYSTHITMNIEMIFPKLNNPIDLNFFDGIKKLHNIIDSKYNEYTRYGNKNLPSKVETNLDENKTVITIKEIHGYMNMNLPYEISKIIMNTFNVNHVECRVTGDLLNEFYLTYTMFNIGIKEEEKKLLLQSN